MTSAKDGEGTPLAVDDASRWEEALRARTVDLPNANLDRAVRFLESARRRNVWGIYPGAEYDRHSSAMAIAALRTAMDPWEISNSTIFFLDKYRNQVRGLGVDPLIDVIELIKDALPEEPELRKEVSKRAKHHMHQLVHEDRMGATARLASLLVTAWPAKVIDQSDAEDGWQFLISTQNKDGSWSAAPQSGGTLTATAMALRALGQTTLDSGLGVRHDAFDFLTTQVKQVDDADEPLGVFVMAMTMLAIADFEDCDYWVVAHLEDALLKRQNEDGGWPEQAGSPSTVEHSALGILALTAAGARSHVPTRLVQAALAQARGRLGDIGEERDRLQGGFEEAVKERCGNLMTESQRLKAELKSAQETAARVPELQEQVARLQRIAEPLTYSSGVLADTPLRAQESVVIGISVVGVIIALILIVLAVFDLATFNASTISVVLIGFFMAGSFASLGLLAWRRSNRRVERTMRTLSERAHLQWLPVDVGSSDERFRALRMEFRRVLDECSPTAREELVYLLYERFIDVPADVAGRMAEQAGMGLGMSYDGAVHFRQWASAAALLEPSDRQILFDQIRRSVQQ